MNNQQIMLLVNQYMGGQEGYLGQPERYQFSTYKTLQEFYPEYCNLNINIDKYQGTIRARFIEILKISSSKDQAKIIRGVLKKIPFDYDDDWFGQDGSSEFKKRKAMYDEFWLLANSLEQSGLDDLGNLGDSSIVMNAIEDAKTLMKAQEASSATDRVHTAFHGYLKSICQKANITLENDASITIIFKKLREQHPILNTSHSEQMNTILKALSSIIDTINTLRNKKSPAHPQERLLDNETTLYIDVVVACMKYFTSLFEKKTDISV